MPIIFLDRLPLPSLNVYLAFTVAISSSALYYSYSNVKDLPPKPNPPIYPLFKYMGLSTHSGQIANVLSFMLQDPFCIWTLLNCGYCILLVVVKLIQKAIFGELRGSESQHLKDKIWNFIFYKFIFIFGVINVQNLSELLMWSSWFTLLGSFHLLAQLCKDRIEYLTLSTSSRQKDHKPLIIVLGILFLLGTAMFAISVLFGLHFGLSTFAFMAAECLLLILSIEHTFLKYFLYTSELQNGFSGDSWDARGTTAYYTELILDLASLTIELAHHLHMLLWSNIFLSMASLVICMHIRYLVEEIRRRINKHRNFMWVMYHLEQSYPMATREELEDSDHCAICWDRMDSARKLPCSHFFHNGCLQSWLEQDTSCPTCRLPLNIHSREPSVDMNNEIRERPNRFFHFDGSRYVSWLPSFSVEVIHTQLVRPTNLPMNHNSQLDVMARQVQQMFENYPLSVIIDDLQITRSIEITVSNILDGRLTAPPENEPQIEEHGPDIQPPAWENVIRDNSLKEDCDQDSEEVDSQFHDTPDERERNLALRKEKLMLTARRRYLERHSEIKS